LFAWHILTKKLTDFLSDSMANKRSFSFEDQARQKKLSKFSDFPFFIVDYNNKKWICV